GMLKLLSKRRRTLLIASFTAVLVLIGFTSLLAPVRGAEITEYPLAGDYRPRGIVVDSAGNVWFTEQLGNRIARLSGATIYEWILNTTGSEPWDVAVDKEGNVWLTEYHGHRVARFKGGTLMELPLLNGKYPTEITVDNNQFQNIWFAVSGGTSENGRIGRVYYDATDKKWVIIEYEIPPSGSPPNPRKPYGVAVSPVDGFVWFTDQGTGNITYFNPWTLMFKEYNLKNLETRGYKLWGIAVDKSGYVWAALDFTGGTEYDRICRLNPWNGEVIFYEIPTQGADPRGLTIDKDGNIWFTESSKGKVARLNPVDQYITEFTTPTPGSYPMDIAVAADGSTPVYFTEWSANKIGRLDPTKGITYSTVNTITSATTFTNRISTTNTTTTYKTYSKSLYSTAKPGETVTFTARVGTNSTDMPAYSTVSTYTETVYVLPTTTTDTTTSFIVSTSTTGTTVTATLTTYVSTTSTTTTTTRTETYYTPVATESTYVTRHAVFTDVVSTTTLTEYAATIFRDKTVTAQFYTSYSTSTIRTTLTSYTTVTVTTTIYAVVTAGMGAAPLSSAVLPTMLRLISMKRRRRSER
ncbi:MAG: virginiamycin B lyase family protein, partial [Candidatus Bathyarchaeia archaeon]